MLVIFSVAESQSIFIYLKLFLRDKESGLKLANSKTGLKSTELCYKSKFTKLSKHSFFTTQKLYMK